jgi:AraC-like DNA-binding protein
MFDPTLTVARLRTRCNLRDNNVSCAFKREVGVSIRDYVETLRLSAALRLLENPALSAAEVSWHVGYEHLPTFYRAFARRYRCTPGNARRNGKLDVPAGEH